jgi:hypothetical protein
MSSNPSRRFVDLLRGGNHLPRFDAADALDVATLENGGAAAKLWEATDLSAGDFADEAARFFHLPRVALPDLLAARSLAKHFSRRFLRETMVFSKVKTARIQIQSFGSALDLFYLDIGVAPGIVRNVATLELRSRPTRRAGGWRSASDPGERFHVEARINPYFGTGT